MQFQGRPPARVHAHEDKDVLNVNRMHSCQVRVLEMQVGGGAETSLWRLFERAADIEYKSASSCHRVRAIDTISITIHDNDRHNETRVIACVWGGEGGTRPGVS